MAEEASTTSRAPPRPTAPATTRSPRPGTYAVTSTAPSFHTGSRPDVVLTAGQLAQINFQLTPGAATETVEITAENTLLDTGSATSPPR